MDIAIDGPKKADESKSVKLNNYMSLENPSYSSEVCVNLLYAVYLL